MTTPEGGLFGPTIGEDISRFLGAGDGTNHVSLDLTLTEVGNGFRFQKLMSERVRFAQDTRQWYVKDPGVHTLRLDPGGSNGRVFRDTLDVIEAIRRGQPGLVSEDAGPDELTQFATRCMTNKARWAMMTAGAALWPIAITSDQLDGDPWLLGLHNGVMDLRTNTLRPGVIDDLITQQADVSYDKDAGCPLWESHVAYMTNGQEHIARYLQLAAGYTLTGLVDEDAYWFLHGQGGTGKSVFVETLQMMMGDYGLKASQRMISAGMGAHTTELTDIRGKRLAFIDELEDGTGINEARVKMIAGGSQITARGIARDDVTFTNTTKLWICSNPKPRIKDATDGSWRRIKALEFNRRVEEMDPGFAEKLRAEWPGILNWCLEGLRRWREECWVEGVKMPDIPEVVQDVDAYRREEDVVYSWMDEHCVIGEEARDSAELLHSLFSSFEEWRVKAKRKEMDIRQFGRALRLHGLEQGKRLTRNNVKHYTYIGIRLMRNPQTDAPRLTRQDVELT